MGRYLHSFVLSLWSVVSVPASPVGPVVTPLKGWSTWNTFRCAVNETLIRESIEALASSRELVKAGYEYILLDDCWTLCLDERGHADKACKKAGPRDSDGRIQVSPKKFPNGFKGLTNLAHSKGLKMGIYTSVSAVTCGGYTGSLGHEAIDAQTFHEWGFDFVKHDTCGLDYSVHDGGLQNATIRMRDGIWKAGGGKMVYYLDSGNPTSPQRVFNPHQRHVSSQEALLKVATKPSELVWNWLEAIGEPEKGPHLFKSWFDIDDSFSSTLTNIHNQVRIAEYQTCGHFNMPDMLTVGMGKQTAGQYRAQFFIWAVLGAPLVLGNDIRTMSDTALSLVTSPEVLKVNQDRDCVQGSMARDTGATETWIKPLSDGSFAVVLLNKGENEAQLRVHFNDDGLGWGSGSDFFPAEFDDAQVRDLHAQKDLGMHSSHFSTKVPGNDAVIVKVTPKSSQSPLQIV